MRLICCLAAIEERVGTVRVYSPPEQNGETPMKSLATVIALSIAAAFAAPAIAQTSTPATQAECEKMADKKWNDSTRTCVPK